MDPKKEVLMFNISGGIGTVLFFILYQQVIFRMEGQQTLAWTVSYMISIIWQHALHRWLVFGTDSPYWTSLFWTYLSYGTSIVLSIGLMAGLEMLALNPSVSWVINLVFTGIINYFMVKKAFASKTEPATV